MSRKAVAQAIAKHLGVDFSYAGPPTMAYLIGDHIRIDVHGDITVSDPGLRNQLAPFIMSSDFGDEVRLIDASDESHADNEKDAPADDCVETVNSSPVSIDDNVSEDDSEQESSDTADITADDVSDTDAPDDSGEQIEEHSTSNTDDASDDGLLLVTVPYSTLDQLHNTLAIIYSKGWLFSKACGTPYYCSSELLMSSNPVDYLSNHPEAVCGVIFDNEKISFFNMDPVLCAAIVHARPLRNIEPLIDVNEKFMMRQFFTWLHLDGPEYRDIRNKMYANLKGHTAFHTPEDKARWTEARRQKEQQRRESMRIAVASIAPVEKEEDVDNDEAHDVDDVESSDSPASLPVDET